MKNILRALLILFGSAVGAGLMTGCGDAADKDSFSSNEAWGQSASAVRDGESSLTEISALSLSNTQQGVSAGSYHSLLLRSTGAVLAWGQNNSGQLGDGSTQNRTLPVNVLGLPSIKAISAGGSYSLAVGADGKVWAWGANNSGQLGTGYLGNGKSGSEYADFQVTPVSIVIPGGAAAVSGGLNHSLALAKDGKLWAWGANTYGQLGDGTTANRLAPVSVNIPGGAIAIAAGWYHSLAIARDGRVWAWGRNNSGQVGNGGTANQLTPVVVAFPGSAIAVAGGGSHSLVVLSNGTVWSWGANNAGQLGDGSNATRVSPIQVPGIGVATKVAAGGYFSLAITSDGVWSWGQNTRGQLGNGSLANSSVPVFITATSNALALSGGYHHSLILRPGCPIWAWGFNAYGQLGDGTLVDRLAPVQAEISNTFYWDGDGDGYGDPEPSWAVQSCLPPPGYTEYAEDCDDFDPAVNPGAQEQCNGLDDNCSGSVDDGNPGGGGACPTGGNGLCAIGLVNCVNGALACVQQNAPASEVCDGLDNNCNGASDEENPGGLKVCSTGKIGACAEGVTNCRYGAIECVQVRAPSSEVCDGKDNDCNGQTDEGVKNAYYRDADGDGYGNPGSAVYACSAPTGYVANSGDCDDGSSLSRPNTAETCDGRDNDCDGVVDEGVTNTYYRDADDDGYGVSSPTKQACAVSPGYAYNANDCDDGRANVRPGANEICDGLDNNCNGVADEGVTATWYRDADGDGYGNWNDRTPSCWQSAGYVSNPLDCNDSAYGVNPGAGEVCDNIDNNCNSVTDEGVTKTWYRDVDGDGYGGHITIQACTKPSGYVDRGGDCNDQSTRKRPGLPEVCDLLDNDCDGVVDEGLNCG
ncbi:MopE-related protein [Stigmatella aurantiaca]|uniref:BNR repeat domain protein n=1 Tax=Stigmatella aurantiaca (strain DW4/3-1) TaxID=378806 RepID=Q09AV4_STIAD|nr:MopE-related protein [Stigmatella aurantiaca]ADO72424.1 Regulator of chromosome condensation [Stigmatella aurantiaca DW4/3-1]EAU68858.1 BNR repeat domain protein [Stigmatella aurantiaca DW4/3-1]